MLLTPIPTGQATLCAECPALRNADPLTGLLDRRGFHARLEAALVLAKDAGTDGPTLLLIDLDRFKAINDTLGHQAGDALLKAAGRRLQGALRTGDVAGRLGGDEFAALLVAPVEPAGILAIAERLVERLSRPYMVSGQAAIVGASIGGAMAPLHGEDCLTLLRHADLALYQAKREGRGRARVFDVGMQARANHRRLLEQDLRAAMPLGQFELFYQPQLGTETRSLAGFEALLRWRHPERGLVSPDAFIPLAEEIGLISGIGAWVLRMACVEAAKWPDPLVVSVNVAAPQFESGRLASLVESALTHAGLPGRRLELEITESALLAPQDGGTLAQLHQLKGLGVQLSLDDFGTGYSSLTQLRSFPFDRVKIDRTFADDTAVVRAIAALGASLGMRTTAEGVETEAQFNRVQADGCTEVQGYLIGRPLPAAELASVISTLAPPKRFEA